MVKIGLSVKTSQFPFNNNTIIVNRKTSPFPFNGFHKKTSFLRKEVFGLDIKSFIRSLSFLLLFAWD